MKINNTPIIALFVLSLVSPLALFAQTPSAPPVSSTVTTTDKSAAACAAIGAKIDDRITKFNDVSTTHNTRFETILAKLRETSLKIKARNLSTAALDENIATLDSKRSKIVADKDALVSSLQEAKTLACGNSQTEFKSKIDAAREVQKTIITEASDMRQYLSVIKDTLIAQRSAVLTVTSTSTAQ